MGQHVPAVLDRAIARRVVPVPEERHLLLERTGGPDHAVEPPAADRGQLAPVASLPILSGSAITLQGRFVAGLAGPGEGRVLLRRPWSHDVGVCPVIVVRLGAVLDQPFDRRFETGRLENADLLRRAPESSPAEQMATNKLINRSPSRPIPALNKTAAGTKKAGPLVSSNCQSTAESGHRLASCSTTGSMNFSSQVKSEGAANPSHESTIQSPNVVPAARSPPCQLGMDFEVWDVISSTIGPSSEQNRPNPDRKVLIWTYVVS